MKSLPPKLKQPNGLLNHILEQPDLPAIIQNLDASCLTTLIRHIGLEDSVEIVSLTTTDQLKKIFDEDLWYSNAPGQPERFNAQRFGLWLDVLFEAGTASAACKIMDLDEDFVILGLSRLITVMDSYETISRFSAYEPSMSNRGAEINFHTGPIQQFENFLVTAKDDAYWDTVCALLMELNEQDHDTLIRILTQCSIIAAEGHIEDDGRLLKLLNADEMIEGDVAADRETRRQDSGFVTPTAAKLFLSRTRSKSINTILLAKQLDNDTLTYFKAAAVPVTPDGAVQDRDNPASKYRPGDVKMKVAQFIETLRNADVLPSMSQKLLRDESTGAWDHHLPLAEPMRIINQTDSNLYSTLLQQLSYVSNILISGCAFQGRIFLPKEAAEAAFSTCNLGCDVLSEAHPSSAKQCAESLIAMLKTHQLIKLFQVGWKTLYQTVVVYTAKAVLRCLNYLKNETSNPNDIFEFIKMEYQLEKAISSGQPWKCNDQIDYLHTVLDGQTTHILQILLQEYPTMFEGICSEPVNQKAPFIWSMDHIRAIRRYLKKSLPCRPAE